MDGRERHVVRWLVCALVALSGLLAGAGGALAASWSSAAVESSGSDAVSVTADASSVAAGQATGYTLTLTGSAPASELRFLLPSHGQPCGYPDTTGMPVIGSDADTNWLVTDAQGGIQVGRWITWTGDFQSNTTMHISVVSPPLGGCFYAGATATSSVPVVGLKKGASVFNGQDPSFGTDGLVSTPDSQSRSFTVTWKMWNGTDSPATLTQERLGARGGFSVDAYTFGAAPKVGTVARLWTWSEPLVIPPHRTITETLSMTRPCGIGSHSLRLRITRSDGLQAGTGDGVVVPLAAC